MTLVSIKNDLIKARSERYAIPLFNVYEQQGIEGVMDGLVEKRAPTIMGVYSPFVDMPHSRALAEYIRCRAQDTDVPVSLMLDHGASVELCLKALSLGFTDVMYDGSQLPIEENIVNTKKIVKAAHDLGAGVEAELGHVGMGDQYDSFGGQRKGFTDPEAVEYFVKETGVDFLAIAFGNAHGLYKGTPQLDFDLVADIRSRVEIPIVMHGGTGISNEQFRKAIAAGISKINFATSILNTATDHMRAAAQEPKANFFQFCDGIRSAYQKWSTELYEVFGTAGRG